MTARLTFGLFQISAAQPLVEIDLDRPFTCTVAAVVNFHCFLTRVRTRVASLGPERALCEYLVSRVTKTRYMSRYEAHHPSFEFEVFVVLGKDV